MAATDDTFDKYKQVGDNDHRTYTKFSERRHYKGNMTCAHHDEGCNRITLAPAWQNYPELDFEWPRQKYELEKVERLMATAYKQGQTDSKLAMRNLFSEIMGIA